MNKNRESFCHLYKFTIDCNYTTHYIYIINVNKRLSSISSNEKIFTQSTHNHQNLLNQSGHKLKPTIKLRNCQISIYFVFFLTMKYSNSFNKHFNYII